MNEEIKDIFNEIKHLVEISNYEKHYHLNDYFEVEHIAKLLNYLTDLQEENQKLEKNYNRIYNENCKLREQHNITDISLLDENEKLNKIINELEKWLKETKKFNCGFKIKSEYIYTYEFVCKNILNKLTELKNEVE